ncbi:MAG: hypothetical protein K1Y36_20005, partial [Blastocatellia bacterium]|nr:hypothetical protein [Blastocatellia bacterium]
VAAALKTGGFTITDVILGDETFGSASFTAASAAAGGWVLTPKQLPKKRRSWKDDLFAYRKQTIELLFQRMIQACGLKDCPVQGLGRNGAFVLAPVWLYQLCWWSNYRAKKPVARIKEFIDAARWRIPA